MEKNVLEEFESLNTLQVSGETLKTHLKRMLESSSQCRAILESINRDTGEYRIVLQGVLESELSES